MARTVSRDGRIDGTVSRGWYRVCYRTREGTRDQKNKGKKFSHASRHSGDDVYAR
jgi:hypothetical protein